MKITPRLALYFVAYATALLAGVGLLAYNSGRTVLRSATILELSATAIEKQAALSEWVEDKKASIVALSSDPTIIRETSALISAPPGSPEAGAVHDRLIKEIQPRVDNGEFLAVMLIDPKTGEVIAATDPIEEGKFKEDRLFFINGKVGPYVQNVYYALAVQGPAMTASAPLKGPDGELLGVLAGRINLEEMNSIVNRRSGLRQSDDAFLVNTSNLFVTQPYLVTNPAVLLRGAHTEAVNRCLRQTSGTIEADDYRGVPALIVYRWLPERELCLIVKMDETEAYVPARAFGGAIAAISALALLVAALLAVVLARSLTRPILALQAEAARFGRGELNTKLPETSRDELGALAREFNQMAASLAEKENQLREYAAKLEEKVEERTAELRLSEERFSKAFYQSPIGITLTDLSDNTIRDVNDALLEMIAMTREQIVGHNALKLNIQVDPELHARLGRELQEQGGYQNQEVQIGLPGGEVRDVLASNALIIVDGKPHVLALLQDITERKRAEQIQQLERARWQGIVEGIADEVWMCDAQGKMSLLNLDAITAIRLDEFKDKSVEEVYQEVDIFYPDGQPRPPEQAPLLRSLRGEIVRGEEIMRHRQTGKSRYRQFSSAPTRDANGTITGAVAIVRDITDQKAAEEKLNQTLEELQHSNAELEQFAYVASHDLQEPLRMISSYVQLLAERYQGKLDSDADAFIAYAVDGANRLQNLINDLLAYSRVGTRGNELAPVSVEDLLDEALENLQFTIEESSAVITHDSLPVVRGDPIQLPMVFQNLLNNAIKFRGVEPPCIHIGVKREGDEWIFSVRDNGIGFDSKFAERIFIIFQRLNTRGTYPGTGIGLAICKRIIQRHDGRIWAESERGKGSIFYFTLPVTEENNFIVSLEENS